MNLAETSINTTSEISNETDTQNLVSIIQLSSHGDSKQFAHLENLTHSQEIRDIQWTTDFYQQYVELMKFAVGSSVSKSRAEKTASNISNNANGTQVIAQEKVFTVLERLRTMPEFDVKMLEDIISPSVIQSVVKAAARAESETERHYTQKLILWMYSHLKITRPQLRCLIANCLAAYHEYFSELEWQSHRTVVSEGTCNVAHNCESILHILHCVLRGISTEVQISSAILSNESTPPAPKQSHHKSVIQSLLRQILLPLHQTNLMANELSALLEIYHEPLSLCISRCIKICPEATKFVIASLNQCYPTEREANSPKVVLLLHEVEQLLEQTISDSYDDASIHQFVEALVVALPTICKGISSDNARIAEKSLLVFANKRIAAALQSSEVPNTCVPSSNFIGMRQERNSVPLKNILIKNLAKPLSRNLQPHWSSTVNKMTKNVIQLLQTVDHGMLFSCITDSPPSTFNTVQSQIESEDEVSSGDPSDPNATYVHRWRQFNKYTQALHPSSLSNPESDDELDPSFSPGTFSDDSLNTETAHSQSNSKNPTGIANTDSTISGHGLTHTFIPTLRFHDLVFGRKLGEGSFSQVMYSKLIRRGYAQSSWPEYAVKIIDTSCVPMQRYEPSIRREFTVLSRITHPNVARLVASFRYKRCAYFVLEYGMKGDLHSQVISRGSLSLQSTRFLAGEVVAAMKSIHALGFAFGDLKPENIVLDAKGHVKLTDFGGARPITPEATSLVEETGDLLSHLQDGDWLAALDESQRSIVEARREAIREQSNVSTQQDNSAPHDVPSEVHEPSLKETENANDDRIEGTAAYLSPELISGGRPSIACDAWAFGCFLYFCMIGRPPFWGQSQREILDSISRYAARHQTSQGTTEITSKSDDKFGVHWSSDDSDLRWPANCTDVARDLILKLLTPDPQKRLGGGPNGFADIEEHPFFSETDALPTIIDKLHECEPPQLAEGVVAPMIDAAWSRRQNSMMWSPMPQRYELNKMNQFEIPNESTIERNQLFQPDDTLTKAFKNSLKKVSTIKPISKRSERRVDVSSYMTKAPGAATAAPSLRQSMGGLHSGLRSNRQIHASMPPPPSRASKLK